MKILIVGGTGMLGRPVVKQLLADGFPLRLLTTHPDKAKRLFGDKVEYAAGDVGDIDSLRAAIAGCEAVYVNLKGGPTKADYIRIEQDGAKNIYLAAKDTGIRKIVQIGGAEFTVKYARHILARTKSEAEKALVESGMTYVILRPSWFCESLPLVLQGRKAVFVGSGKRSFFFLAAADYAKIVSRCFQSEIADNKALTIFGPEPMPIPEALRRFLVIVKPEAKVNHLSVWLARLVAMTSFSKGLKAAVDLMAFFDKHDDADVEFPPDEADRLFGRSRTTVDEWAKAYKAGIQT
ncbi:MAG: NAD(P)H-binding protein [candidate division Zixibacteria bacterium]|nr:NAD(P)H-binding protein [candidate division Zixibacteria bacterium]